MALLVPCQEVDVLIERLRSDDFTTREEAEAALIGRGLSAVPALKKHDKDPELEVRLRVCRAIEEIGRRERVRGVRPGPVRLTLQLAQVPLSEALKKTFEPFGVKADVWPRELERRTVSLELKQASLWKALDAFCAAGGVHLKSEYTMHNLGWGFRDGPPEKPIRWIEVGEGRLSAGTEIFNKEIQLRLRGLLPHGSMPAAVNFENVEVVDERGRRVPFDTTPTDATAWRCAAGPTSFESWKWTVAREGLKDVGTLCIRGAVVIKYPHDLERVEYSIRELKGPIDVSLGGVTLTLKSVTASGGDWGHETEGMRWRPGTPEQSFRDWFEDAEGRLYGECCAFGAGGKYSPGGSKCLRGKESVLPSKFVLARLIGEDAVRIPFELKNISLR